MDVGVYVQLKHKFIVEHSFCKIPISTFRNNLGGLRESARPFGVFFVVTRKRRTRKFQKWISKVIAKISTRHVKTGGPTLNTCSRVRLKPDYIKRAAMNVIRVSIDDADQKSKTSYSNRTNHAIFFQSFPMKTIETPSFTTSSAFIRDNRFTT